MGSCCNTRRTIRYPVASRVVYFIDPAFWELLRPPPVLEMLVHGVLAYERLGDQPETTGYTTSTHRRAHAVHPCARHARTKEKIYFLSFISSNFFCAATLAASAASAAAAAAAALALPNRPPSAPLSASAAWLAGSLD